MLDGVVGSNFLVVIQEGNFRSFAIRQKVVGARPQHSKKSDINEKRGKKHDTLKKPVKTNCFRAEEKHCVSFPPIVHTDSKVVQEAP